MASPDTGVTLVANDSHVSTTIDDEVVILNSETGEYQGLVGIGPMIWDLVQTPTTSKAVVEAVRESFDVDGERCEREVGAFLDQLVESKLVDVERENTA